MQAVQEDGKPAVTHFTVLERFGSIYFSRITVGNGSDPSNSGHMQYIGFPLAGDPVYGLKRL